MTDRRQFAIITGASSGIGFELARECLMHGFDVLIAADRDIESAAAKLRTCGPGAVTPVAVDLATTVGVDTMLASAGGRSIDALMANAATGLGHAFTDQPWDAVHHIIDTNITGTLYLLHQVSRTMKAARNGRILVTGSIVSFMPGAYQAVYNASKAFLHSFSFALRHELKDSGVTVTCLMPGATETDFFEHADMLDTRVGQAKKDDPAMVAAMGFKAMIRGDADVVPGWHNKLAAAIANVAPASWLAAAHEATSAPGSAKKAAGSE